MWFVGIYPEHPAKKCLRQNTKKQNDDNNSNNNNNNNIHYLDMSKFHLFLELLNFSPKNYIPAVGRKLPSS